MAYYLGVLLYLLGFGMLGVMLRQHIRGTHPLLSVRNFALVGLIIYQFHSAALALMSGNFGDYQMSDPFVTGLVFTVTLLAFMLCFSFFYRKSWGVERALNRFPLPRANVSTMTMLVLAVIFTIISFALRFGVAIPLVGIIANRWGITLAALACGLAAWVWARHVLNPLMLLFMVAMVSANTFNVLWGNFGRRPLVALGAAILLAMFYSYWRNLSTRKIVTRIAIFGAVPVMFVALYTGARESQDFSRTAVEQLEHMARANLSEGIMDLFSGQECAPASMWCIESYTEQFPSKHMLALRYLFLMPIPRDWWEDKPKPLSTTIASDATIQNVNRDLLTIGPGIVGHIHAEGGLYVLILYAFVGAWILRFADGLIWNNPENPLVVLAVGSALGDVMGLSRGEASAFMFNFLLGAGGAYVIALMISRLLLPRTGEMIYAGEDAEPMEDHPDFEPGVA